LIFSEKELPASENSKESSRDFVVFYGSRTGTVITSDPIVLLGSGIVLLRVGNKI